MARRVSSQMSDICEMASSLFRVCTPAHGFPCRSRGAVLRQTCAAGLRGLKRDGAILCAEAGAGVPLFPGCARGARQNRWRRLSPDAHDVTERVAFPAKAIVTEWPRPLGSVNERSDVNRARSASGFARNCLDLKFWFSRKAAALTIRTWNTGAQVRRERRWGWRHVPPKTKNGWCHP
jgi:hypothetical protein